MVHKYIQQCSGTVGSSCRILNPTEWMKAIVVLLVWFAVLLLSPLLEVLWPKSWITSISNCQMIMDRVAVPRAITTTTASHRSWGPYSPKNYSHYLDQGGCEKEHSYLARLGWYQVRRFVQGHSLGPPPVLWYKRWRLTEISLHDQLWVIYSSKSPAGGHRYAKKKYAELKKRNLIKDTSELYIIIRRDPRLGKRRSSINFYNSRRRSPW